MYSRKFNEKTGVSIKESAPTIPKPSDDNWSGVTLPWVAYGYSIAFYTAATSHHVQCSRKRRCYGTATGGRWHHGPWAHCEQFEAKVLNPAIARRNKR